MITIFGTLHLRPGRHDEARRDFRDLVDECVKEPGCRNYVVSADLTDPGILYIFEEWDDDDALATHRQSAHFAAHQSRAGGYLQAAAISQYESVAAERRSMGPGTGSS